MNNDEDAKSKDDVDVWDEEEVFLIISLLESLSDI